MRTFLALLALLVVTDTVIAAQDPMPMPMGDHHMPAMSAAPLDIATTRDASGTSWLPDASPMQGLMRHKGPWMLMLHGNGFLQYIEAGSDRGRRQFGSVNWIMGMAERGAAGGQVQLSTMFSLEPLTVGRCGYPALLASGEQCRGAALHDQQHPHDLFMELAGRYRRALSGTLAFEIYGGPVAEPALGPTAFPHRRSAMAIPIAPMSHHWLDSSHVSFGVATGGLYGRRWKAEASAFNGREPDDRRFDFDLGPMDSYSGRLSLNPLPSISVQVSAGHLAEAEVDHDGSRSDVNRITASLTHHRLVNNQLSATTIAWGQNRESGHSTSAVLAETSLDLTPVDTVLVRGELARKTAHELDLPLDDKAPFGVGKLQIAYTRWVKQGRGVKVGVGGSLGVSVMSERIAPYYGGRRATEAAVYLSIRPQ